MTTIYIHDDNADYYAKGLGDQLDGLRIAAAPEEAEVLVGLAPRITPDLIASMPQLKWVHALTTGVDTLTSMDGFPEGVALTNTSGIHGPQMSELAILLMLSLYRDFQRILRNQSAHAYERWPQPVLTGKTVCIVGLGSIAEALATRCAAFGMTVTGVSNGRAEVPGFAQVFRRDAMDKAVSGADFVVVLVPYTEATHHIIDADVLKAMQPHAYLINIARGGCVDEAALISALKAGGIAGAGLDVFATEPLPQDDPLWDAPNTIITPHIGGMSTTYHEQARPILIDQMRRYLSGGTGALTGKIKVE